MQGTQYATKRSILCRGAFCGPTRNISIKKWEIITITKLKKPLLSEILDETMPFTMDKSKSKKGNSVSKQFVLLI